jgi:mono/diheme cytochrome c family protein
MRIFLVTIVLLAATGAALFWYASRPETVAANALGGQAINLQNGKTMFVAGGCSNCHATPNQPDRTQLGGGLALKTDFGTFYAPNISPDPDDGIGRWTEEQFVTAMVKGTSPQGTHYYPVFPYTSYHLIGVADLRDLYAHLKTLPAVKGRAPEHDVASPFNIRRLVGLWKLRYLGDGAFRPDPTKSEKWNRGAYLVNGPGHCGECHTPRDRLGGPIGEQHLAGGPNPEGEGWIPNITQFGLKDWSEGDIAFALESGLTPDGDSLGGPMAPVIRGLAQLPARDREAIAAYLKSLPPVEGPRRPD